ncbi:hypothetical protein M404DRAFT_996911 [Pisolithus tinctorius Marx 270]|uniref:Uncharacterized protein n=1 Tax=Pisolithus tinctorius Marx 270 TaxID=870435 RepID=A0A0C3KI86_PISTI|nr:hypothetical protein M404DRAFT_996911 [Pisolithus tinctorius Marx 270]
MRAASQTGMLGHCGSIFRATGTFSAQANSLILLSALWRLQQRFPVCSCYFGALHGSYDVAV